MSPLCSRLTTFYRVYHPVHQTFASCGEPIYFELSKRMSMSPLCGRLNNFSRVSRPVLQKSPLAANPCIFSGQSGRRCHHSAAVWLSSISCHALAVRNRPLGLPACCFLLPQGFPRLSSLPGGKSPSAASGRTLLCMHFMRSAWMSTSPLFALLAVF